MTTLPKWFSSERLIRLLTQQRDLYERLRLLSERQQNLISGDRPEALLSILEERRQIVTQLAELNGHLAPFRQEWNGLYDALEPDVQQQASRLLEQINGMLKVILDTDERDGRMLAARKQSVGQALSATAGGRSVHQAYARQAAPTRDDRPGRTI
jgi:hypothetical protein